jgi:branched-chain amino acid aminotransferase
MAINDTTTQRSAPLNLTTLSFDDVVARMRQPAHQSRTGYLAMYTSWLGGIVTDPQLMWVPIDDHIVHRGDGVFEAVKCVEGRIYGLDRHLARLMTSAERIGLNPSLSLSEIREVCVATVRAAKVRDCMLRLYVSRGPGGFTANPYESISSQVYLVVTSFKPMPADKYEKGVSAMTSSISVKEGFFANVKSCNYLPNVLMKKESVDHGVDFTVSKDEKGNLAEGSTENFAIISRDGDFIVPAFDRILKGVTAIRMMELAQKCVSQGLIRSVKNDHIHPNDVRDAREAMFLGTTLDVLPVTVFDGRQVGDGRVGPVAKEFLRLLLEDLKNGEGMITRVD